MSSETERSGGGKGEPRAGGSKKTLKSNKLDRAIEELESAFSDWENLNAAPAPEVTEEERRKAKTSSENEEEFRKKTRKLLSQLMQQLSELND